MKKGVLVCLKCGSTRLKRTTFLMGIIPQSSYVCEECGFECPVMLEIFPEQNPDK
jgi:predicted RNA-binding Zn-ribbon protein involved in translation (DUF1610 family)